MTRREAMEAAARENALLNAGISRDDAEQLRRISMTLHRWHERECGIDGGCIEREERWAIERAAWLKVDRWWDGESWNIKNKRRTYSDEEKARTPAPRPDATWRDVGAKPYWLSASSGHRFPIPDRETGARRRLAAIMARYPALRAYILGAPRGAALYILRLEDAPVGAEDSHYSRGLVVY